MKEQQRCNGAEPGPILLDDYRCFSEGVVFEGGRWWCLIHAPSSVARRGEKLSGRRAARAAKNRRRRERRELVPALFDVMLRLIAARSDDDAGGVMDIIDQSRALVAKAEELLEDEK